MGRLLFWFTVFFAATIIPILAESEGEENPKQQTPGDNATVSSSDNVMHLIMNPKNINDHCTSELKICGTGMCVTETKGNSENVEIGSQSSIRDTNKKQVSHEEKECFCRNNEAALLVTQDVMEVADKHFVEYRVREVTESGCKAVVCDWKLTVPYEHGGNPDVIECVDKNTCMVVCDVRKSKLVQEAYDYTFLALMALPSIMSVILYITIKCYMRNEPQQAQNQSSLYGYEPFELMGEYEDVHYYTLMYNRLPRRHHLRPRMRLPRR